jgi:hypothetical protein
MRHRGSDHIDTGNITANAFTGETAINVHRLTWALLVNIQVFSAYAAAEQDRKRPEITPQGIDINPRLFPTSWILTTVST